MTSRIDAAEAARVMLAAAESGQTAAAATVVASGAAPELVGQRLVLVREARDPHLTGHVGGDGGTRSRGALGDPRLEAEATTLMDEAIADPRAQDGLRVVQSTIGGGESTEVELYIEIRRPIRELVVVGAGHIAQPMAHIGALLGYRVTVLDDRPDFATRERFPDAHRLVRADFSDPFADVPIHDRSHLLLVTRGHKYDYECLIRALRMDPAPAYIGMIGSRRRVRATYVQLIDEGVPDNLIERIHAPVGLDIGAETPEEIAVAVAAELVLLDRGGSGSPLKDVERVAERFFGHEREEQEA
ncbi:MAG: XdhC family protein [Gemmatimonadetes bacterium]|nr:XdhC family protein [Gemmatimonadota bacterium]NNL30620.1 XdhC family protein [Gemmatimonadota bacterium]